MATKIPVRYIDTTNYVATVHLDETPESPREWDNLGTMICSHRNYILGDEQFNADEYDGWHDLELHLREERGAVVVLPLYLYDHSGISMYTTGDTGYRQHEAWDSGQVGFIYASRERLLTEYGGKRVTKAMLATAERVLRAEIETYDMYLRGEVYRVEIETESGLPVDSCWGFFGWDGVEDYIKGIIGEATYELRGE